MDVEVEVRLHSEDGTLDERLTAFLFAAGTPFQGWSEDRDVRLELALHVPETTFTGGVSSAQGCMAHRGIAVLGGQLDVEATVEQRAPSDPVDGPYSQTQRARMVVAPIHLRFDEAGVHGSMDAWLYGLKTGRLQRTYEIATFGEPD